MGLAEKNCVPCRGGVPALGPEAIAALRPEVPRWEVVENHHLARTWRFPDFRSALAAVNRIGAVADEQDHHPEVHLSWGRVRVEIWTHAVGGLTENDFIFAAKCDALLGD
jgi:4a-hydroxytetrahydrobiopterin dehydratase